MKTALAILISLGLIGCATRNDQCRLLEIAYNEQDELNGPWYDETAATIDSCGYAINHKLSCRGKDASGSYNIEKIGCE